MANGVSLLVQVANGRKRGKADIRSAVSRDIELALEACDVANRQLELIRSQLSVAAIDVAKGKDLAWIPLPSPVSLCAIADTLGRRMAHLQALLEVALASGE